MANHFHQLLKSITERTLKISKSKYFVSAWKLKCSVSAFTGQCHWPKILVLSLYFPLINLFFGKSVMIYGWKLCPWTAVIYGQAYLMILNVIKRYPMIEIKNSRVTLSDRLSFNTLMVSIIPQSHLSLSYLGIFRYTNYNTFNIWIVTWKRGIYM